MHFQVKSNSILGNSFLAHVKWQEESEVLLEEEIEESNALVVYNDEVNSFEYVISTLIEVCEHSPEQAEQCTLQIHFRGKCAVKSGSFDE